MPLVRAGLRHQRAVNLSARHLSDGVFALGLMRSLDDQGFDPGNWSSRSPKRR